jgi:hypothetical protein
MSRTRFGLLAIALALVACKASINTKANTGPDRASALSADVKGSGGERCDATKADREVSEYDTSGDGVPDVRKVFLNAGTGVEARLVTICRESDVNGDGKKDVIRYYDDEGRSLREEADRNFDGKMDVVLVFQDGKVVRKELDENHDGRVDTKLFLENGKPIRAERDLAGRSTDTHWQPDRWEYYEDDQMVRMGTDLDGDQRVDRWDRDLEFKSKKDAEEEAAEAAAAANGTGQVEEDQEVGADAGAGAGAGAKSANATAKPKK